MSRRVALVASPGGHCDELFEVADKFANREERFWITARTAQTAALLVDEDVEWVPHVGSRQGRAAVVSLGPARKILRRRRPTHLTSTGAALAVPYMVTARALGTRITYLESATRLTGPSITGRIAERVPGATLYRQVAEWRKPRPRWTHFPSIFDGYTSHLGPPRAVARVLVTVGSERFDFHRAVDMVLKGMQGRDVDLRWQTGHTKVIEDLPGQAAQWWPGDELAAAAKESDLVITHAGVGSILMVLRTGSCPVVIPRSSDHGEHIDDHQEQLSRVLESRGLVVVARSGRDVKEAVDEASRRRIVRQGVVRGA